MATYEQLPGKLNLAMTQGDTFSVLVDFSVSLTAHTVAASVTSLVTGQQVIEPTTSVVSAANGQVNVSLTDTQTLAIPAGTYGWHLGWETDTEKRTALTGFVEVTR